MKRITILLLLLIVSPIFAADTPINLGSRRELMIDRFLIDSIDGDAALTLNRPKDRGVVLKFDKPWEGRFCGYMTVIRVADDNYLLYYRGYPDADHPIEQTCVAQSKDGINWTRPNLGIYDLYGTRDNNVILENDPKTQVTHNFAPFLDSRPGVPKSERFKALGGVAAWANGQGLFAFASEDGLHWKKINDSKPVITINEGLDSQNLAFWSETENCYVCYMRSGAHGVRWVSRTTSDDFIHWEKPIHMEILHNGQPATPEHIYINQTSPYFRAPHIYISTAARFMPDRRVLTDEQAKQIGVHPKYFGDISDGILMSSRGGTTYQRTFMEGFIRPGTGYEFWVSRTNYPACGVVQTGPDEMSVYVDNNYGQPTNCLRRYSMRLDGFASVRAGYDGGQMLTKLLKFTGKKLSLNFATSAAGGIKVQLETPDGKPIEGFTFKDCQEIIGNEIDRKVRFGGKEDLSALAGKPIRIRFQLKDADLYALQFIE
jgi:hypothetical protein